MQTVLHGTLRNEVDKDSLFVGQSKIEPSLANILEMGRPLDYIPSTVNSL